MTAATAVSFFEDRADVPELMEAWKEGYRRVRALPKEDEDEMWTFILLRRMTLLRLDGQPRRNRSRAHRRARLQRRAPANLLNAI